MKFELTDSYKVDDSTEITDLFEAPGEARFDSVISRIEGFHPEGDQAKRIVNDRSQKAYFILKGEGTIFVGDKEYGVEKDDFVYVPIQKPHALEGNFRSLIITSPPFDPEDEKIVVEED